MDEHGEPPSPSPLPTASPAGSPAPGGGEHAVLERLEADVAAVESAMATMEALAASGAGGAAAEIAAVVSADRFPVPGDGHGAPAPTVD